MSPEYRESRVSRLRDAGRTLLLSMHQLLNLVEKEKLNEAENDETIDRTLLAKPKNGQDANIGELLTTQPFF